MGCCEVSLRFSTTFSIARAPVIWIVRGMTPRHIRVAHSFHLDHRLTMKQAYSIWSRVLSANLSHRHLLLACETWTDQKSDCTHLSDMFTSETTKRPPPPSLLAMIASARSSRRQSVEIKLLAMLATPLSTPNIDPGTPCLSPSESPSQQS